MWIKFNQNVWRSSLCTASSWSSKSVPVVTKNLENIILKPYKIEDWGLQNPAQSHPRGNFLMTLKLKATPKPRMVKPAYLNNDILIWHAWAPQRGAADFFGGLSPKGSKILIKLRSNDGSRFVSPRKQPTTTAVVTTTKNFSKTFRSFRCWKIIQK